MFELTWRIVNTVLVLVGGGLLIGRYAEIWPRLARVDRMIGIAFVLLVVTAGVATVEQMLNGTGIGVRTGFTTLAYGWLIAGLAASRSEP